MLIKLTDIKGKSYLINTKCITEVYLGTDNVTNVYYVDEEGDGCRAFVKESLEDILDIQKEAYGI